MPYNASCTFNVLTVLYIKKNTYYLRLLVRVYVAGSPGQDSDKPGSTMVDIQCLLDSVGASEMVIDLIVSTKNDRVFEESILLGIALLWGGNTQIQVHTHTHTLPIEALRRYRRIYHAFFTSTHPLLLPLLAEFLLQSAAQAEEK